MRQEVGAREGTKITEKGGMVAWKIEVRRDPVGLVPVNVGIVTFPENHADAGTASILESRINAGLVHVQADMLTKVQIPRRSDSPTAPLWML